MGLKNRITNAIAGFRNNSGDQGKSNLPFESLKTNEDRYVDPLIRDNVNDITNPLHRERVAIEDPLACMFFWEFQFEGWADYPKFYESDQIEAPEIMQDIRALLMDLKFKKPAIVAAALKQIHGWQTTIFNLQLDKINLKFELDYTIFSEMQCMYDNTVRENKTILGWNVLLKPKLPLNRTPKNFNLAQTFVPNIRDQPSNIIFDTRGDEKSTWGFGISRLEHTFDPLVKLRMESDADNFRKAIFPMSLYPPDWDEAAIDKFFEKISKISRTTAVAAPAAKDDEGKLYDSIPSFTFMSPAENVKQTGSGQFGGLSSEWTRLLAGFKHTMGYVVGGGAISSSQAAAGVDLDDDVKNDIYEWNLTNQDYIKKFLEWLESKGIIELPESYTIKSHWQWKHDEIMAQQAAMQANQLLMDDEQRDMDKEASAEKKEKENRQVIDITLETLIENKLSDVLKSLLFKRKPSLGKQKAQIQDKIKAEKDFRDIQLTQLDEDPGIAGWQDVNSESGNVLKAALDMGDDNTSPTIYVKYDGNKYYSYQDPDVIGDPQGVFQDILARGGDAIWEHLRASESKRSGFEKGKAPKGSAKTGGGQYPYAGKAHESDYKKERGDPLTAIKQKEIRDDYKQKTAPLRAQLAGVQSAIKTDSKVSKVTKAIGSGIKKAAKFVGRLTNEAVVHELPSRENELDSRHPLLHGYRSISQYCRENHRGKATVYKLFNEIQEHKLRVNAMIWGNSFSAKNPFIYPDNTSKSGYVVEYQCPESIKKLNGKTVPVWIDHRGKRTPEDYVGTYTINSYDEKNKIENATYDIDWDLVDQWFIRNNEKNWIKPILEKGLKPDTSTEYNCNIKYDKDRKVLIQTDFDLEGLALVKRGNCSKPYCALK